MGTAQQKGLVLCWLGHVLALCAALLLVWHTPSGILASLSDGGPWMWPLLGLGAVGLVLLLVASVVRSNVALLAPAGVVALLLLGGLLSEQVRAWDALRAVSSGSISAQARTRIYAVGLAEAQQARVLALVCSTLLSSGVGWALIVRGNRRWGAAALGFALFLGVLWVHSTGLAQLHYAIGREHGWWGETLAPGALAGLMRAETARLIAWPLLALFAVGVLYLVWREPSLARAKFIAVAAAICSFTFGWFTLQAVPARDQERIAALSAAILWDVQPPQAWLPPMQTTHDLGDTLLLGREHLRVESTSPDAKPGAMPRSSLVGPDCGALFGEEPQRMHTWSLLLDESVTFRELACALVALQYGPLGANAPVPLPWGIKAGRNYAMDYRWSTWLAVPDPALPPPYFAATRRFAEVKLRFEAEPSRGHVHVEQDAWRYRFGQAQGVLVDDKPARARALGQASAQARLRVTLSADADVPAQDVLNAALATGDAFHGIVLTP